MRILISDYSGHPFQVQLSRELARRGHEVLHVFSESFQTPKGALLKTPQDPDTFSIAAVKTDQPFAKNTFVKRRGQEIEIGKKIGKLIGEFAPEVVVSSNAPLDTQRYILAATRSAGASFVFWVQDIYSHAIGKVLADKIPVLGRVLGHVYRTIERSLLRKSDHAVLISDDFIPPIRDLAGEELPLSVVENWAPLDEIERHERDNEWTREHFPPSDFRAVYSGTLGFKHNPDLLLSLAKETDIDVFVFSEGEAAEWLRAEGERQKLDNLTVSGWLPFSDLPKALAGADALLVILEPEAGIYSVPSKTLTYMCVGRPIIGAMPAENLAARLISREGMGLTVPPSSVGAFIEAATSLSGDAKRTEEMGANAMAYASRTFDIETIGQRFEEILHSVQSETKRN